MTRAPRLGPLFAIPALLVLAAATTSAQAPPAGHAPQAARPTPEAVELARGHFLRAENLYNDRAFEAALIELQKAYELAPSYRILYNIGIAQLELGDYAAAMQAFQRYLSEGGDQVPASRRDEVTSKMRSLRDRVATLRIQTNQPDAEVFVDDIPVGRSPLAEPVLVNAGRRRLAAGLPGQPQVREVVAVAGGDAMTVTLNFPTPTVRPAPSASPQPSNASAIATPPAQAATSLSSPAASSSSMVWVGWTTTGLLAAGTVTAGLLAMSAANDLEDERDSFASDPAAKRGDLDNAADRATTLGLVTDVLGAATLLVGGITLYATVAGDQDRPAQGVEVRAAPGAIRVSGSF